MAHDEHHSATHKADNETHKAGHATHPARDAPSCASHERTEPRLVPFRPRVSQSRPRHETDEAGCETRSLEGETPRSRRRRDESGESRGLAREGRHGLHGSRIEPMQFMIAADSSKPMSTSLTHRACKAAVVFSLSVATAACTEPSAQGGRTPADEAAFMERTRCASDDTDKALAPVLSGDAVQRVQP